TAYNNFASDGKRVIGFARKTFVAEAGIKFDLEKKNFPLEALTFLGVCAIADPPREEAAEAIKLCRHAGIRVFMITGDHHVTATAIAKKIGLIEETPARAQSSANLSATTGLVAAGHSLIRNKSSTDIACSINMNKDYEVLHGERISRLTEEEWDRLLMKRALVFARTTPEQKLLIVEQCQKRKHLIGMTGDGVNDAPALKKADIGIAMGNGSEVAKQASDIILMDDNFSSIVKGVEEGRLMYENLKKLLGYTMPHTFAEAWPVILNFCFGFPMGITAIQILSIDLGTEILPGVSMSKEPIEGDVMHRPPRKRSKGLISNALLFYSYLWPGQLESIGCFLAYLYIFVHHGISVGDLWMSAVDCWRPDGQPFHSNGRVYSVPEQMYIARQACSALAHGHRLRT
ncbi:Protein CATP-2, partial [Aphelenchoides avenae]